jgi:hypothetical protein
MSSENTVKNFIKDSHLVYNFISESSFYLSQSWKNIYDILSKSEETNFHFGSR